MARIKASFELLKASWDVLRSERQLCWYPLISMVCAVGICLLFIVPIATVAPHGTGKGQSGLPVWAYPLVFFMYFLLAFVQSFFNAALISAANQHFDGGHPTFGSGVAAAWRHAGTIAGWALIAATVGMFLRSLQERAGLVGRLVVGAIGVGWNLLTFFVVPVLVFEGVGPITAVKRSGSLFKARWGEAVVGSTSIGVASVVVTIPAVALIGGGIVTYKASATLATAMIVIGSLAILGAVIATSAMQQIYNTALYRYATDAPASGHFSPQLLQQTFRPKGATR
jgi:hypothetical protein